MNAVGRKCGCAQHAVSPFEEEAYLREKSTNRGTYSSGSAAAKAFK